MKKKRIAIIGGGLGGMAAAITLAQNKEYTITLIEKNNHLGGKLNTIDKDGFRFDLGPSILTMPHLFETLYSMHNKNLHDYMKLIPVRPHWRNFFPDGTILNLEHKIETMLTTNTSLNENDIRELLDFYRYTEKLYQFSDKTYFMNQSETKLDTLKHYNPLKIIKHSDMFKTMDQAITTKISNPYLKDTLNFFIKYVGSSPYEAPALLHLLSYIQWRFDLWYVDGGLMNLGKGLESLINELDITVLKNTEVVGIESSKKSIEKVLLKNKKPLDVDLVVSNMEFAPFYEKLTDLDKRKTKKERLKYPPTCSGFALHLGLDKTYPQLAHHNIFHANDAKEHFDSLFKNPHLTKDPTIYLVAPMKTDSSLGPKDHEIIKILPHIPHLQEDFSWTESDYQTYKENLLKKLEDMGLTDLRKHIITEEIWTPESIEATYYSTKGSIYGVRSDKKRNLGFKHPKQSKHYKNLYFVGGSTNPGGGMPMVVLSGQQVYKHIKKHFE